MRIGSLMILARVLDPKDFGLVGMVTVVTGVFALFKDAGLSMVTVQRATITHEQVSTLFSINLLVGTGLAVLSVAIAPALVVFYREPRLLGDDRVGDRVLSRCRGGSTFGAAAASDAFWHVGGDRGRRPHRNHRGGHRYGASRLRVLGTRRDGRDLPAVSTVCVWLMAAWIPGAPRRANGDALHDAVGSALTPNGLIVYVAYNMDRSFWGDSGGPRRSGSTAGPINWSIFRRRT